MTEAARPGSSHSGPPLLEVRTYAVTPGRGGDFHRLMSTGAVPMLRRWAVDVVLHQPADQDPDRYILIRRFGSEPQRQAQLSAFYGSEEWLRDWDMPIMSLIESYHVVAVPLVRGAVEPLLGALHAEP